MKHNVYVLIACEESQAECKAFREMGFIAYSCDIKRCRKKGNPDWHICGDVTPYLQGKTTFITQSRKRRKVPSWNLIIAHPPCTYLSKVSAPVLFDNGRIRWWRVRQMILARRFFYQCLNAKAQYVAVENPIPMKRAELPNPSCFIQPSWFGVKYTKKTLYWLRNLPPLMPTIEHPAPKSFTYYSRDKYRSRTFPEVARALANQWGNYILDELAK